MKEQRGRQRSTKTQPSREQLVIQYTANLIAQKSLIEGKIDRLKANIDRCLDNFSSEVISDLKLLSEEISTLTVALDELNSKLT